MLMLSSISRLPAALRKLVDYDANPDFCQLIADDHVGRFPETPKLVKLVVFSFAPGDFFDTLFGFIANAFGFFAVTCFFVKLGDV